MSNAIKQAHGHLIRMRYELQQAGLATSQDAADRPIAIAYELAGIVVELLRQADDGSAEASHGR